MLFGQKRAGVGFKLGIFLAIVACVFAAYFVIADLNVAPSSFADVGQGFTTLYNITVNNTAVDVNFTQINITLPAGFVFVSGSQGTDSIGDFTNDSSTLSWNNSVGLVLNQTWNQFWFSAVASNLGNYNITVTSLDSNGVTNSSNITVSVRDVVFPLISILYPSQGAIYGANVSQLNYTVYDLNLDSCWYSWNSGFNNFSTPCGNNASGMISIEGFNYWTVWANDTSGNVNSSSVLFVKDTTPPLVLLNSPGNNSYSSSNNIRFNWTVIDNVAITLLCNLTIDGIVNVSSFVSANGSSNNTMVNGLSDGAHPWNIGCADSVGNFNISETRVINVDTVFPLVSFGLGTENSGVYVSRNWTFANISAYDLNEANVIFGLWNSTSSVNSTTLAAGSRVINWTMLPDGKYYYNVTVVDLAGNRNSTETRNITLDTKISVSYNPSTDDDGANLSRNWIYVMVRFNSEPNPANFTFRLYNSTRSLINITTIPVGLNATNWTNLADGIYYFNFTGMDLAGNIDENSPTRRVTLDTTNPNGTLMSPGNGSYLNASQAASQNYTADLMDNLGIRNATLNIYNSTSLVNQTMINFVPNTVATTVGVVVNLIDNVYTWFYSLFDWAGNGFVTANNTVTIDTINPQIGIVVPSEIDGSYVSKSNIIINVSASDLNLANVTIDLFNNLGTNIYRNVSAGSNYINVAPLVDGVYRFNATAVDLANNKNYTVTRNVTLDTINPAIAFANPSTATGFYNNSRNWIDANISVGDVNLNNANVYFYNSGGLVNQTAIVGGNSRSLYLNWTGLPEGWYYVNATADDLAGNRNATETRTIVLDSSNPLLTVFNPINGTLYNYSQIPVNLVASDAVSGLRECDYRYSIGAVPPVIFTAPCSNITMDFGANQGMNGQIVITARDWAGNTNTTVRNFAVDTIPPAITINLPTNNQWLNNRLININLTVNDATSGVNSSTIDVRNLSGSVIDSSTNSNSGNFAVALSVFADGNYSIFATSRDNAGNVNVASVNVTVDTGAPSVALNSPADGATANIATPVYYNWTASDGMSPTLNCTLRLFGGGNVYSGNYIVNNGVAYSITLAGPVANQYYWNVTCSDLAGNTANSVTRSIVYDLVAPTATLLNPANNAYVNYSNVNFTANVSDNIDLDNATFSIFNSTGSLVNQQVFSFAGTTTNALVGAVVALVDGTYSWLYNVVDWLSNSYTTPANIVTVDTTWPLILITNPVQNANYTSATLTLSYNLVETNPNACWWTINGGVTNNSIVCGQSPVISAAQGWNSVAVYVNDRAGHLNSSSVTFFVDSIAPAMAYMAPTESDGSAIPRNNIMINVTANDSGVGLANITVSLYNSVGGLVSSATTATSPNFVNVNGLSDGTYRFSAVAYDRFGNMNGLPTRTITIDTIGPVINISQTFVDNTFMALGVSASDVGTGVSNCTANRGVFDPAIRRITDSGLQCETNYTYTVICWDYAGNNGTATQTFSTASCLRGSGTDSVAGAGSGGGGSVKPIWTEIYTPSKELFAAGTEYTKTIPVNGMFSFNVDGIKGYVGVLSISEKTVKIVVASGSSSQEETMTVGAMKKFEIDNDGNYDIQVTLNKIDGNEAEFTIKYIQEKMLEDSAIKVGSKSAVTGSAVSEQSTGVFGSISSVQIIVAGIVLIGVLGVIIFVVSALKK